MRTVAHAVAHERIHLLQSILRAAAWRMALKDTMPWFPLSCEGAARYAAKEAKTELTENELQWVASNLKAARLQMGRS